jgi:site-specific DNA recombinase
VGEVFTDRDISAWSKRKRPNLERMLDGVRAGTFGAVVVFKLDRLTRNIARGWQIIAELTEIGVRVLSVHEDVDTSTATGKIILSVHLGIAEQSSEDTSIRVSARWASDAAKGLPHLAGVRMFGYTKDFQVIAAEREAGAEAVRRILAGESIRSVARYLNAAGHRTAAGNEWSSVTMRDWAKSPTIANIRQRTAKRTGEVTSTEGTWEPIISVEEHQALLVRLNTLPRGRPTGRRWLLSGFARCGRCQSKLYVTQGDKPQGTYACRSGPGTKGCGRVSIKRAGLDAYVTEQVLSFLSTVKLAPIAGGADVDVLRAQLAASEARLATADRSHFVTGELTVEQWKPLHVELAALIESQRQALEAIESASVMTLKPGQRADLDAWWAEATDDQQREALRQTLARVTILPGKQGGAHPTFQAERVELLFRGDRFGTPSEFEQSEAYEALTGRPARSARRRATVN